MTVFITKLLFVDEGALFTRKDRDAIQSHIRLYLQRSLLEGNQLHNRRTNYLQNFIEYLKINYRYVKRNFLDYWHLRSLQRLFSDL